MLYKILFSFLALGAMLNSIKGQSNPESEVYRDSLAGIILDNPQYLKFTGSKSQRAFDKHHRVLIDTITLEDGDLKINYKLYPFLRPERKFTLHVQPKLKVGKTDIIFTPSNEDLTGDLSLEYDDNKRKKNRDKMRNITWGNFEEDYQIYRDKAFHLLLEGTLNFRYDCEGKRPVFLKNPKGETNFAYHWKKQWPHWVGLLVGGGMIWISSDLNKQANAIYLDYRKAIFLEDDNLATELFAKVGSKSDGSRWLQNAATGILITDVVSWISRYVIYQRRTKNFETYDCEKQLQIGLDFTRESLGFQLVWNLK